MCCGEEMHRHHAGHIDHEAHHGGMVQGMCGCGCGGRRDEYRESLKNELEGVEEELKELQSES